ncbi:MAG: phosphoribosylaminoimidazole-succinocarboxamide synthase [Pseudonocardiales bacterium]|nr:phosphoribosylaminoimidazole-succinocarboxamide synthase [Pseudonocardiales bacterium]
MIPPDVRTDLPGLTHLHSGKVRDLYRMPGGELLIVASDRISAFDHILSPTVADKGRILTAMTAWWFRQLDGIVGNHLISVDAPAVPAQWRGRAMVCRPLRMVPVEAVARGYLTGSGLLDYRASGAVCGVPLPAGLTDGARLAEPIFTPATKADLGEHDENVSYDAVVTAVGPQLAAQLRDLTLAIYERAAGIAAERGIILADTKFEFGHDPRTGELVLGDEVLTPDSSRFWPADQWRPGRAQPSFDKQYVRDWLLSDASGWDRAAAAPPPALPDGVIAATRARYVEAYERLTGLRFADWPGPGQ